MAVFVLNHDFSLQKVTKSITRPLVMYHCTVKKFIDGF